MGELSPGQQRGLIYNMILFISRALGRFAAEMHHGAAQRELQSVRTDNRPASPQKSGARRGAALLSVTGSPRNRTAQRLQAASCKSRWSRSSRRTRTSESDASMHFPRDSTRATCASGRRAKSPPRFPDRRLAAAKAPTLHGWRACRASQSGVICTAGVRSLCSKLAWRRRIKIAPRPWVRSQTRWPRPSASKPARHVRSVCAATCCPSPPSASLCQNGLPTETDACVDTHTYSL